MKELTAYDRHLERQRIAEAQHIKRENMKIYCELCKKVQPVQIDNGIDVETKKSYQDIVCNICNLVIASGTDIAPPKKEWVGLTDQDIDLYALDIGVTANKAPPWLVQYARDIEQVLKEKNT